MRVEMSGHGSFGFACQQLGKSFRTRGGMTVEALAEVSFTVAEREFVCIVGPSGCGKTTMLKIIAGLLEPSSGRIVFGSDPPSGQPRNAMVFQEHGLFPWMSVVDNVAFGLETRGVARTERRERALAFIDTVGLSAFAQSYPHELSVGMRQRVGIARAFVADPHMLLMDEPFGSLDAQTRLILQEELLRIWRDHQKLVLYVTHDIDEAILLGDRILVMSGRPGQIREEIPIPLGRPRDPADTARPDVGRIKWHIWKTLEAEVRSSVLNRA